MKNANSHFVESHSVWIIQENIQDEVTYVNEVHSTLLTAFFDNRNRRSLWLIRNSKVLKIATDKSLTAIDS